MKKYVYLFELDSVRKTDEEIVIAQRALYDEIVLNGNCVVLTYNQLVDSKGFFSLLADEEYQKNLIRLFEKRAICISQYGDVRTVSQYLMNSIDDDKKFIYSALPLRYTQKRLTALMKRCLMYSDLSEIYDYIAIADKAKSDPEQLEKLNDLFIEVVDGTTTSSKMPLLDQKLVLQNLYSLLATVLRLSMMHQIYIPPRDVKEYEMLKLSDILNAVLAFVNVDDEIFLKAADIIRKLPATVEKNNNRSVYIRQLKKQAKKTEINRKYFQYAQAMIDLCYNYACENSICNISKHYNVSELIEKKSEKPTFLADFFFRMEQYWKEGKDADTRFLNTETKIFKKFTNFNDIPDFHEAVRLIQYADDEKTTSQSETLRYEFQIAKQKKQQKNKVMKSILSKIFFALVCILIACVVEFVFNWAQDTFDTYFKFDTVIETLLMLFLTEYITNWLSKKFPAVLSLSEAVGGIWQLICDAKEILFRKSSAYFNQYRKLEDTVEPASQSKPIGYVCPKELKKYIALKNKSKDQRFAESDVYPIADTNEPYTVEKLLRLEEISGYRFGVVYQSKYNTMVVDPICSEKKSYFPYERIWPSAGNGVVILTKYRDKFLLLNQFRHAIRREQYAFPRGFAEEGSSPEENVIREISEELGAKVKGTPQKLGQIATDSGLTGACIYAYSVEIEQYEKKINYEGIRSVVELSAQELDEWVRTGKIDDGFTLSTYFLYKMK